MSRNNELSFNSGGSIAPATFVTVDTAADEQVVQSTTGDMPIGISQEWMKGAPGIAGSDNTIAAALNDQITVYGLGDDCALVCGGAVTRGDFLKPDASARGVTCSSTQKYGAQALQSGVLNQKIRVVIVRGTL